MVRRLAISALYWVSRALPGARCRLNPCSALQCVDLVMLKAVVMWGC